MLTDPDMVSITTYLEISAYIFWAGTIAGAGLGFGWRLMGKVWGE